MRQIVCKISRGDLRLRVELSGYQQLMAKADELVGRGILAAVTVAIILFAGLSLLGNYSPEMPYYRGLPALTWWALAAAALLLGTRRPRRRKPL